ncbi:MAG: transposase, partial [Sphingomonas sp. SCN 67-18]
MVTIIRAVPGEPGIPAGFPILFDANMAIIEPAFAYLLEHAEVHGHSQASETVRTYGEHLYEWFDALEQSNIKWDVADEHILAAYRSRMLEGPSQHTGRPFARSTINARVATVYRFYSWALDHDFIRHRAFPRPLQTRQGRGPRVGPQIRRRSTGSLTVSVPEQLPRPMRPDELARLFAQLAPTARLAGEWALCAGLRRKELCALAVDQIPDSWSLHPEETPLVGVPLSITKGDRPRTVYPPVRLLDRTHWYIGEDRARIVRRARNADPRYRAPPNLLLNEHGRAMTRKRLTALLSEAFAAAGLPGTLHSLRHTFAMVMLTRLQIQARANPALNPLKIVQVLLGHASIATTAIYLRCVELYEPDINESLAWLYGEAINDAG